MGWWLGDELEIKFYFCPQIHNLATVVSSRKLTVDSATYSKVYCGLSVSVLML